MNRIPRRTLLALLLAVLVTAACLMGPEEAREPPAMPSLEWVPSPYHRPRESGARIDSIVIHTTESRYREDQTFQQNQERAYVGTVRYFQENDRQVSAHFVIGPKGEITQMVAEEHAAPAQTYYNDRAIGIECAGWGDRPETWTPELLDALVDLCAALCHRWNISVEHPPGDARQGPFREAGPTPERPRYTGVGLLAHSQIQPWNKRDPGPHFPWNSFLRRVRERLER